MRHSIVSNRLPFTAHAEDKKLIIQQSPGGMAAGLEAYIKAVKTKDPTTSFTWIGWPGGVIDKQLQPELQEKALEMCHAIPVYLSKDEEKNFYYGFCNKTIWPLFHNFPSYCVYKETYWSYYKRVNRLFADEVVKAYQPGDIIFVNDYQLMLVSQYVREKIPDAIIGFFLHIPFPSHEIFALLPRGWKKELLIGLLGANLIGFHTQDFVQNFLQCARRLLGYEHSMGEIVHERYMTKVTALPLGIDVSKFTEATKSEKVQEYRSEMAKRFDNHKIILSVDRLDYTKGIANRLYAYELFLQKNPQWHNNVILTLIAAPSRTEIDNYQKMKQEVDELIGRINGRFGSISWMPIVYQYRAVSFEEIVALYSMSDIALITPIQDGMNLIAKEYIVSRIDKTGVLILSEVAGSAKELTEALIVNPNSIEEMGHAMKHGLEMPLEEQIRRNTRMQERLNKYTIDSWSSNFQTALTHIAQKKRQPAQLFTDSVMQELNHTYQKAHKRLLLLDYDGTLVPFSKFPELAKPKKRLLTLLSRLNSDTRNTVVLISGRDKQTLSDWFGQIHMRMTGEHGAWIKDEGHDWRTHRVVFTTWKQTIRSLLQFYVDRLPGTFIEEKDFSLAWHYRNADQELSNRIANELLDDLISFTVGADIHIMRGNKVIEVRNAGISKADAGLYWLSLEIYDFVLAIGDDTTDEDLFTAMPKKAYTLKVGKQQTAAKHYVENQKEVIRILEMLLYYS